MTRVVLASLLLLGLSGCVSDQVKETAETVLTLQGGTISELRERRGSGPFTTYDVAPDVMLSVLERAAGRARDAAGEPVKAVFVSTARREVVAKERARENAQDEGYSAPFRTAMLAVVHPVRDRPEQSRVEIHTIQRGPFHRGVVNWQRDMPGWIAAEISAEAAPLTPLP